MLKALAMAKEENKVMCHQSTSLVVDGNNPDIPGTQCKMGQIAPNFQVRSWISPISMGRK